MDQGQNLSSIGAVLVETEFGRVLLQDKKSSFAHRIGFGVCIHLYLHAQRKPDSLSALNETLYSAIKTDLLKNLSGQLNPLVLQKLLFILRKNNLYQEFQVTLREYLFQAKTCDQPLSSLTLNMPMLTSFLSDIGPQCTQSAISLADAVSQFNSTSRDADSALTESQAAEIIVFMTLQALNKENAPSADDELATSLLNNITSNDGNSSSESRWNIQTVSKYLSNETVRLNWLAVSQIITTLQFRLQHEAQCDAFFRLFPGNFPQDILFNTNWKNVEGQLSIFQYMLQLNKSCFNINLSNDEQETSQVIPQENSALTSTLAPRCFACTAFISRVFHLSESIPPLARDVFVMGLLSVPEIIMCSLVRLETDDQIRHQGVGERLKNDLFNEVINRFFKYSTTGGPQQHGVNFVQKYSKAFAKMYNINPQIFGNACIKSYRSCGGPHFPQAKYISLLLKTLPGNKERESVLLYDIEVGIQIGLVAADFDVILLQAW